MGNDKHKRLLRSITFALMSLAAMSMVIQFMTNFSIWLDEAALANNIVGRSFSELWEPLSHRQAAPIGFLLLSKLISSFLGTSEYALRLLPLIFGLLSIWLFYNLGNKICPPALVFGMALLATSQLHLRYAAEFKQYIGDSFWALLLTTLAFQVADSNQPRSFMIFTFFGCVGVWFSYPIIFILAGTGSVLFWEALLQGKYIRAKKLGLVGALWVASFGFAYLLYYEPSSNNEHLLKFMQNYWHDFFVYLDPESIIRAILELMIWVGGLFQPILLILNIFGLILGIRYLDMRSITLLLTPLGFMMIASMLQLYPVANRLILFLIPNIMLIVSVGWWRMTSQIISSTPRIGWMVFSLLLFVLLARIDLPFEFPDITEAREALLWVDTVRSDDPLYATERMAIIATYYNHEVHRIHGNVQKDDRYWIIAEEDSKETLTSSEQNHMMYEFRNAWVICVTEDTSDCPQT